MLTRAQIQTDDCPACMLTVLVAMHVRPAGDGDQRLTACVFIYIFATSWQARAVLSVD